MVQVKVTGSTNPTAHTTRPAVFDEPVTTPPRMIEREIDSGGREKDARTLRGRGIRVHGGQWRYMMGMVFLLVIATLGL